MGEEFSLKFRTNRTKNVNKTKRSETKRERRKGMSRNVAIVQEAPENEVNERVKSEVFMEAKSTMNVFFGSF